MHYLGPAKCELMASLLPAVLSNKRFLLFLEILLVLLLPITIWWLFRISLFNNGDSFLDPWVYFGYVHNFQDLISRYGLLYYSVRFGLIFPLIVLIKLLGPIAGYLFFVYLMHLLPGGVLYVLFRCQFSVHAAITAYILLIASPWFGRTVLWTHPDASAVPYLVTAVALIFIDVGLRRSRCILIGTLMGLAANSNIFALSIGGLSSVAYAVFYKQSLWQRMRRDVPWIITGFAMVYIAGAVSYYLIWNESNFLKPTVDLIKWSVAGSGVIYQLSLSKLAGLNYLYIPPFLILILSCVIANSAPGERRLAFAALAYLIGSVAFVTMYEALTHTALLELFYYFSFLLVPCIMCMTLVSVLLARLSSSEPRTLYITLASFLVPPMLVGYVSRTIFDNVTVTWMMSSITFSIVLLFGAMRFKALVPYAAAVFAFTLQMGFLSTGFPSSASPDSVPENFFYSRMYAGSDGAEFSRYALGMEFIESMPKYKKDSLPIYFWYSTDDELANALQSTYLWGYSRLMTSKNKFPSANDLNLELLEKPSSLVIFDQNITNVDKAIKSLATIGITYTIERTKQICKRICYSIVVLNVDGTVEASDSKVRTLDSIRPT